MALTPSHSINDRIRSVNHGHECVINTRPMTGDREAKPVTSSHEISRGWWRAWLMSTTDLWAAMTELSRQLCVPFPMPNTVRIKLISLTSHNKQSKRDLIWLNYSLPFYFIYVMFVICFLRPLTHQILIVSCVVAPKQLPRFNNLHDLFSLSI